MSRSDIDLDGLILRIHAASLSPDGWRAIMRELMAALGGHTSLMHGVSLRPDGRSPWALLEELDPALWQEFATHWVDQDAWRLGAQRTGRIRTGCVSVGEQLVDRREFLSSPYYNELLKRANLGQLLNVCLLEPAPANDMVSALCFYRGHGEASFSTLETGLLKQLAPHLSIAARNFFQAESLRLKHAVLHDAVDSVKTALLAIDCSGRLLCANQAGEDLLRSESLLRLVGGLLSAGRTVAESASLARALMQLRIGLGTTVLLTDALTKAETVLTMAPATHAGLIARVAGLIWAIPTAPEASPVQQIARLFRLTPAEQRLLRQLANGDDLGEAAASLQVAVGTVRSQVKSIFHKTGRHGQAQLLQLVSKMAVIAPPRDSPQSGSKPALVRALRSRRGADRGEAPASMKRIDRATTDPAAGPAAPPAPAAEDF